MSWFSNLLPAISNFVGDQVNQSAQSMDPRLAIPARIAQNPGKFVENAATDTGNIIKGGIGLLPAIGKSVMQGTEGKDLGNAVKSMGEGYKSIIQDPYGSFINSPVSTALSITPLGGPLGKLGKAGKVASAGEKVAGETNAVTDVGNRFLRSQYSSARPSTIEDFTPEHLNQLANYGITKPKQVIQAHDIVTGENGIAPKIIRGAIAKANPIDSGGLQDVAQNIIDHTYGQTDRDAAQFVKNTAVDFASKVPGKPKIDAAGNIIDTTTKDPLETYQFAQNMRKEANQLTSSPNETKRAMGQAYKQFISELDDRLYNKSGANDILNNSVINPNDLQRISEGVSPQFAQEVQNVAQNGTIHDMKHLQQPFVTGNQAAVEASRLAKSSPMSIRNALAIYLTAQGNPILGGGIILGNTAAGQNLIGKGLRALGGENTAESAAGMLPAIKGGVKTATSVVKTALPPIVKGNEENNYQSQKSTNNTHIGATIASNPTKVNTLPGSQDQISFDQNGHVGLFNPYDNNNAITKQQYQDQLTALNAKVKSAKAAMGDDFGNPSQLLKDTAAHDQAVTDIDTLNALNAKSRSLDQPFVAGQQIQSMGNKAVDDIRNGWSNIALANGNLDQLAKLQDGKYSKLAQAMKTLQDKTGVAIFQPGMSLDVAEGNLKQAISTELWNEYYSQFASQGGYNQPGSIPPGPASTTSAPSGNSPLPPIGNDNSGYGTPHPFVY